MSPIQIRNLSSPALIQMAEEKAADDRRLTVLILQLLSEIYQRRAYLELGYGTFRDFVVKHLKYSDSCASLRIDVMFTLIEFPEVEEKLLSGSLSLSVVSQAEITWRQMKKAETKRLKEEKGKEKAEQRVERNSALVQSKDVTCGGELANLETPPSQAESEQTLSFDLDVLECLSNSNSTEFAHQGFAHPEAASANFASSAPARNNLAPLEVTKPLSLNKETKAKILKNMEDKSVRAAKKALAELAPKALPREKLQRLTKDHLRLSTVISDELNGKLGQVRALLSHKYPRLTHAELFDIMADLALKEWRRDQEPVRRGKSQNPTQNHQLTRKEENKNSHRMWDRNRHSKMDQDREIDRGRSIDRNRDANQNRDTNQKIDKDRNKDKDRNQVLENQTVKNQRGAGQLSHAGFSATSASQSVNGRSVRRIQRPYTSVHVRRELFRRAGNQCQFVNAKTGLRCPSVHLLETDHAIPLALGGSHDIGNMRVLCRPHNALMAVQMLGEKKMRPYWSMDRRMRVE